MEKRSYMRHNFVFTFNAIIAYFLNGRFFGSITVCMIYGVAKHRFTIHRTWLIFITAICRTLGPIRDGPFTANLARFMHAFRFGYPQMATIRRVDKFSSFGGSLNFWLIDTGTMHFLVACTVATLYRTLGCDRGVNVVVFCFWWWVVIFYFILIFFLWA